MQITKIIPAPVKTLPVLATLLLGTSAVCNAQNPIKSDNFENITIVDQPKTDDAMTEETRADNSNTEATRADNSNKTASWDVAARTFQFLDGANMSGISAGISKNWENLLGADDNLSAYCMAMAGYNFGSKLPTGVAMGYFDYKYPNQNKNVNLSAEAYCEAAINKESSYVKPAVTPIKLNMIKNRWYFGFDPRVAFNIAQGQVNPAIEVLATVSAQIYKDWSAYVIGQCYDAAQYKDPSNYSINVGLVKRLTGLPRNKSPRKLD